MTKSALLIMDVQPGIVDRLNDKEAYLDKVAVAVSAAHKAHVPVIYVVVGFLDRFPEVSTNNKSFSNLDESMRMAMVDPSPSIAPAKGDRVVIKHRVSAFSGSDLEKLLRSSDIQHLILAGIATSGVVLSTVREAADKDFQLTVLSDICADYDEEVHSLLINKLFPRQADVMTSLQWAGTL
jgi:nicotinamidase-related amidase